MSLTTAEINAADRLANHFNANPYDPATNPGGLANDGHRQPGLTSVPNFVQILQDTSLLASAAAREATAAATSSTNAGLSESNALASKNLAYEWAQNPLNVEVTTGQFSAYHWAQIALGAVASAADTNGTSTTSLTIGTGNQTLTTQTGKTWVPGQTLTLYNAPGQTMSGAVYSYSGSTLVVTVSKTQGSGTYASWSISPSSAVTDLTPGSLKAGQKLIAYGGALTGSDGATASTFTYDGSGRVSTISDVVAGNTQTTTFTYNTDGSVNTAAVVYGGRTLTYTCSYNSDGSLAGISSVET